MVQIKVKEVEVKRLDSEYFLKIGDPVSLTVGSEIKGVIRIPRFFTLLEFLSCLLLRW